MKQKIGEDPPFAGQTTTITSTIVNRPTQIGRCGCCCNCQCHQIGKIKLQNMLTIATYSLGLTTWALQNQNSSIYIQSWASRNNLCLNASKTKELIVYKRGGGKCRSPLEVIPGAARVTQMKVLGVTQRRPKHDIALGRDHS